LARAAARGRYSRFHAEDLATAADEAALYAEAAAELERLGHPAFVLDTTAKPAGAVAARIVERILLLVDRGDAR
jgi:hypothetical protein